MTKSGNAPENPEQIAHRIGRLVVWMVVLAVLEGLFLGAFVLGPPIARHVDAMRDAVCK